MYNQYRQEDKEFQEKVVKIRRVSKKTTGGNYVTFSALVVVGNRKGRVGIGLGRSLEVPPAIQKAISYAKKHMMNVPMRNKTIPHEVRVKFKSAKVLIKPAPEGTGLKVGSVTRVILDLAGVENASGKIIGSRNQVVNTYAIMKALSMLRTKF
jgi:small subunit ribosomal protein S5